MKKQKGWGSFKLLLPNRDLSTKIQRQNTVVSRGVLVSFGPSDLEELFHNLTEIFYQKYRYEQ